MKIFRFTAESAVIAEKNFGFDSKLEKYFAFLCELCGLCGEKKYFDFLHIYQ